MTERPNHSAEVAPGLPGCAVEKNTPAGAGAEGEVGSIPGSGQSLEK